MMDIYTSATINLNRSPSRSRRKSGLSGISLLFRNHTTSRSSSVPETSTRTKFIKKNKIFR